MPPVSVGPVSVYLYPPPPRLADFIDDLMETKVNWARLFRLLQKDRRAGALSRKSVRELTEVLACNQAMLRSGKCGDRPLALHEISALQQQTAVLERLAQFVARARG